MCSEVMVFPKEDIHVELVRKLIAGQFPQWAHLPVRRVAVDGWDNRTFRLGEELSVRLPSAASYAGQVQKEQTWLPKLAPLLPLPIPEPVAMGEPGEGYPWHWSVYRWREGEIAERAKIADLRQLAVDVAQFLAALQRIDPTGGPPPGTQNFFRGGDLAVYDGETREALNSLDSRIDTRAAREVWEVALAAKWSGLKVWVHGDVSALNLLVENGRLSAVIDFGCSCVGDPACDTVIAWTFFEGESREAFLNNLPVDESTWARGRGWALWKALITLAPNIDNDPAAAEKPRRVIEAVIGDHQRWLAEESIPPLVE